MSTVLLAEHLNYVSDRHRMDAFRLAVARVVKPGDVVVDLGCGTGVLGLLALHAGARRIYAIDDGPMLDVARETMVRAKLADRVTFIAGLSTRSELPEPADVIVCDQVGYFGFDAGVVQYLDDARRRFLRPGGTMIPTAIDPRVVLVSSERCHALVEDWRSEPVPNEMRWLRESAIHSKHAVDLRADELVGPATTLGSIDLSRDAAPHMAWSGEIVAARDATLHGLGGWFECILVDGVRMTNDPTSEHRVRRSQAFLPLLEAVPVKAGDVVAVRVSTRPADSLLSWEATIGGRRFAQSTFLSAFLGPEALAKRDGTRVPRLTSQARARTIVLSYCDGVRTMAQIEEAVMRDHPTLLPSREESARFVARVLGNDTC